MNALTNYDPMLADSVEEFLAGHCNLQAVRRIEAGAPAQALWDQLLESGFADALVSTDAGGSGLRLLEAAPIFLGCGRHAVPLPLAHTALVRAVLAQRQLEIPAGPITIASQVHWQSDGGIQAAAVPYARTAQWVLVHTEEENMLLPLAAARTVQCEPGVLSGDVHWSAQPEDAIVWSRVWSAGMAVDWRAAAAVLTAAQIAGAMERVCEMTIAYANERVQFGKPIGKLQAIQQQVSVLAEHTFACKTAVLMGLCGGDESMHRIDDLRAAVAKARTSEAVVTATSIAHAVHGAIGVSEEYDLQMLTRALHAWRAQYGSEGYWNARLGAALLDDERSVTQFIQQRIAPILAPAS